MLLFTFKGILEQKVTHTEARLRQTKTEINNKVD
jgi:hypothetical protein